MINQYMIELFPVKSLFIPKGFPHNQNNAMYVIWESYYIVGQVQKKG